MTDRVTIRIPASTGHIGLVRATATALAAMQDFIYDRIMDLHIAIDEVSSRVMATATEGLSRLEVGFEVDEESLRVTVRGDAALREGATFMTEWSEAILQAVTDKIEVEQGEDGAATAWFQVSQGVRPPDLA